MKSFFLFITKKKAKAFLVVLLTLTSSLFLFLNCTQQVQFQSTSADQLKNAATNQQASSIESTSPPRCSFNGKFYAENDHVTAFQNSAVSPGEKCISEDRVCHNGSFSGSFQYTSCQIMDASSCLFNGQVIPTGGSVPAFQNSNVPTGQTCQGETRVCTNGLLSGSYNYASCTTGAMTKACQFNGMMYNQGDTVVAYVNSSVPYGQVCQKELRVCKDGSFTGSANFASCEVGKQKLCDFNGKTLADGEYVMAYQNSSVSLGLVCQSEKRVCNSGVLSGSFQYSSCSVTSAKSCLFNGKTLANGEQVKAYQNSTVPFGQTCQSEMRTCNNGALSGSYAYSSCSPNLAASCIFNGSTVASGQSVIGFATSTVPSGQSCLQQTRTCNNGSLSGSYNFASCAVNQPAACIFNSATVANGQTVLGYASSTVPYGQTCQQQTRTCNNGSLSGSYNYSSCSVNQPSSCYFNGMNLASGQTTVSYASSTVPFGQVCSQETRTCNNGVLSGSYNSSSCTTQAASSCQINGQTIPDGSSVDMYQAASVPFGQTCQKQTRTCNNGSLSGSYTASSCASAGASSCTTAWGQTVSHGTVVNGYSVTQVAFPQSCESYKAQQTCNNGSWVGAVASQTCSTLSAASCNFNGQTVAHNSTVMAYQASTVPSGSSCQSEARLCNNGSLSGSYTATSCTVSAPAAPTSCEPFRDGPSCAVLTKCQNGTMLLSSFETRNVPAWNNINGVIGQTVLVTSNMLTFEDPRITLTYWKNTLNLQCQSNGTWKQVSDGYCSVTLTIPDSADPACTAPPPENSGGG